MPSVKLRTKQKPNTSQVFEFEAIGTHWLITTEENISESRANKLLKLINERINQFDKDYSRFRSDSLITAMSKKSGTYTLPDDAETLMDIYYSLYNLTSGMMTPLVGQLLSDAGYDASYSLKPKELKDILAWDQALDYHFPYLEIKKPVLIDVGAAGKGYLVDIIAELLKQQSINQFSINAGGDILNFNASSRLSRVGLEHPLNINEVIGIADINNKSICGSAPNRRKWDKFNHIMNPITKSSADNILATWVVADTTLIADAIATALFFTDPSKLKFKYDFEYAIIKNDLSPVKSINFPAEFFIKEMWLVK